MGSLLCIGSLTCEQRFGGRWERPVPDRSLAFMGHAAPPSSGCGAEQPEVAPALKPRLSPSLPSFLFSQHKADVSGLAHKRPAAESVNAIRRCVQICHLH